MGIATLTSQSQDSATTRKGKITPSGYEAFVEPQFLTGDVFSGTTVDSTATGRWTVATASGGTVTQATGAMTFATSTNAAGSAQIPSNYVVKLLPAADLVAKFTMRFGTAGIASNLREFGLRVDASNYAVFALDGTSWVCRVYTGAAEFDSDVPISIQTADSLANMEFEIRINKSRVHFVINGQQAAEFASQAAAATLFQSPLMQLYAKAVNTGSTVSNTMIFDEISCFRSYHATTKAPKRSFYYSSTSDALIFRGPGELVGVDILEIAGGQTFILYDNTAGSGTKVFGMPTSNAAMIGYHPIGIELSNGLYVDVDGSNADDFIIYYRA
jgi:hypothetical protein